MPTKTSKTLAVEGIDNRGDAEVPFGFVYFTDDLRVTFSKDRGVGTGSNWGPVSQAHRKLAAEALEAAGIILS